MYKWLKCPHCLEEYARHGIGNKDSKCPFCGKIHEIKKPVV